MALAVEWLPEEWPEGIPNLKQLLVVAPLTTSILLLFGCGNRNLRTVWLILGRVAALVPQDPPTSSGRPRCTPSFRTKQADFPPPLSFLGKRRPAHVRNLSSPLLVPLSRQLRPPRFRVRILPQPAQGLPLKYKICFALTRNPKGFLS